MSGMYHEQHSNEKNQTSTSSRFIEIVFIFSLFARERFFSQRDISFFRVLISHRIQTSRSRAIVWGGISTSHCGRGTEKRERERSVGRYEQAAYL